MSYKTGFYEGRLGIGLSSTMGMGDGNPRYPLDINGDIRLTGSIVNGDGQVLSLTPAAINWTIDDDDIFFTAGGNVGIGTTSPYSNLHINKGTGGTTWNTNFKPTDCHLYLGGYEWGGVGTTLKFGFGYIDRIDGNIPCYIGARIESVATDGEHAIVFGTRNSNVDTVVPEERMCITHDGNVGIGTTGPFGKLDIKHVNWTQTPTASTMCDMLNLMVSSPSTTGEGNMRTLLCFADGYRNNSATKDSYRVRCRMSGAGFDMIWNSSATETLGANTTNNNFIFARDYTAFMNKNVGIGTTSPLYKLEVKGGHIGATYDNDHNYGVFIHMPSASYGRIQTIRQGVGYNYNLALQSDGGNVGIGTTSIVDTRAILHIKSSGGIAFQADAAGGVNSRNWRIRNDDLADYGSLQFCVSSSHNNSPSSASDAVMTMLKNKNVGIGTTSPLCGLQVGAEAEDSLLSSMKFARFMGAGYRNHFPEGAYSGFSCDNHGTYVIGNNCHIKYNGEITITNTHTTMSGVAICMPGNGQSEQGSILFYTKPTGSVTRGDVAYDIDNGDETLRIDGNGRVYHNCDDQFLHSWNRPGHSQWWAHIESNTFTLHKNGIGHCARFYANANQRGCEFDQNVKANYTLYKTSEWTDGKMIVGAGPMGNNPSTQLNWVNSYACVFATNGNLHLDSRTGNYKMYLNYYSGGDVHAAGAVRYSSDDRLKHNEKDVVNALDVINKLDVLTYFKSKKKYAENHNYELDNSGNPITDDKWCIETGLIAQKVKEIPELEYCVSYTDTIYEDDDYSDYFVNYNDIFCYNIAATQELDRKVIALENENAELKAELAAIKQHLGI